MHIPGASPMYTMLGLLTLLAGILALIMPYKVAGWVKWVWVWACCVCVSGEVLCEAYAGSYPLR